MTREDAIDEAVRRSIFDGSRMRTMMSSRSFFRPVDVFDDPLSFFPSIRSEFKRICNKETP